MFDWIGSFELLFILILAGIVMGPKRIASAANWLGRTTAYLQNVSRGFAQQLQQELNDADEAGDMKDMLREMNDLRKEVTSLRRQVTDTATSAVIGTQQALNETKEVLEDTPNSIMPPSLQAIKESEESEESEEDKEAEPSINGSGQPQESRPSLPNALTVDDDLE